MRKISNNILSAFATSTLCTIWMLIANNVGLLGWAGFTGCTAYFAVPKKGLKALPLTFASVCSGMIYAMVSIYVGNASNLANVGLAFTFVTTFLMCAASKIALLAFVPGAFMGSFSTFAAGGNLMVIPSILIGVLLGYLCDQFGIFLCKEFGHEANDKMQNSDNI